MPRHPEGGDARRHPLHDAVFGRLGEGPGRTGEDMPETAADEKAQSSGAAVQPERNQPLRSVGDTDQGDRQPDNDRRR